MEVTKDAKEDIDEELEGDSDKKGQRGSYRVSCGKILTLGGS